MAAIGRVRASLRVFGEALDPDEVSALLGRPPSRQHRKGDKVEGKGKGRKGLPRELRNLALPDRDWNVAMPIARSFFTAATWDNQPPAASQAPRDVKSVTETGAPGGDASGSS